MQSLNILIHCMLMNVNIVGIAIVYLMYGAYANYSTLRTLKLRHQYNVFWKTNSWGSVFCI